MKMGRPENYLPSSSTVLRDAKLVFAKVRQHVAQMLQKYDGELNFATDAWTAPNHKVFVALSMHLEHKGEPLAMLLDIIEVPKVSQFKVHTSKNNCAATSVIFRKSLIWISDRVTPFVSDIALICFLLSISPMFRTSVIPVFRSIPDRPCLFISNSILL
jgi:hypothetical protein